MTKKDAKDERDAIIRKIQTMRRMARKDMFGAYLDGVEVFSGDLLKWLAKRGL